MAQAGVLLFQTHWRIVRKPTATAPLTFFCNMRYDKIGVFLSSKSDLNPAYEQAVSDLGRLIGSTGRTLVYGGAAKGLMEVLARSVKQSGGRVFGMVPDIIAQRGLESDCVDVTFRCANLSDRKEMMARESDVMVVMPGGIGTLDEAFTVMANSTIGIERKPVIFCNIDGCWSKLLCALDQLYADGLASGPKDELYQVADNMTELAALLG